MKKSILIVLLTTIFSLNLHAQDYDEVNLLGLWELESSEGVYFGFSVDGESSTPPSHMYFGRVTDISQLPSDPDDDDIDDLWGGYLFDDTDRFVYPVTDFLISNSNKLHIDIDGEISFRFVIEELSDQKLRLKSYDGGFTATYKRVSSTTKVKEIATTDSTQEEYYNLQGIQSRVPHKGINIVRRGSKVKKEIR